MYNFNHDGSKMKLHFSNEQYFINEFQKTVTAVADVYVSVPEYITRTISRYQLPNGFLNQDFIYFDERPIQFRHTVRCLPGDVWDEEKGQKIAMAALEAKAYRSMEKRLVKWEKRFEEFVAQVRELIGEFKDKSESTAEHDERYIKEIS